MAHYCLIVHQIAVDGNKHGTCAKQVEGGVVMRNGDMLTIHGVTIEAVPAYNLVHKRENGQPFHPKGAGNGYVMAFGDKRVYVAADTENIPEMKVLENIDCAFQSKISYPYHFGDTDTARLVELLSEQEGIEIRIRKMA